MRWFRPRVPLIVTGWLMCQVAAYAAAPIVLLAGYDGEPDAVITCACPDRVPGQACPMHAGREGRAPADTDNSDETRCRLRSGCPTTDAALLSLAAGLGAMPETITAFVPTARARVERAFAVAPARAERPDAPPPRS